MLPWLSTADDCETPSADIERIVITVERTAAFDSRLEVTFHDGLLPNHQPFVKTGLVDCLHIGCETWNNSATESLSW
jgi:hypothetical protein